MYQKYIPEGDHPVFSWTGWPWLLAKVEHQSAPQTLKVTTVAPMQQGAKENYWTCFLTLLHTAHEVDIYSRFDLHIYLYALFMQFDCQFFF